MRGPSRADVRDFCNSSVEHFAAMDTNDRKAMGGLTALAGGVMLLGAAVGFCQGAVDRRTFKVAFSLLSSVIGWDVLNTGINVFNYTRPQAYQIGSTLSSLFGEQAGKFAEETVNTISSAANQGTFNLYRAIAKQLFERTLMVGPAYRHFSRSR